MQRNVFSPICIASSMRDFHFPSFSFRSCQIWKRKPLFDRYWRECHRLWFDLYGYGQVLASSAFFNRVEKGHRFGAPALDGSDYWNIQVVWFVCLTIPCCIISDLTTYIQADWPVHSFNLHIWQIRHSKYTTYLLEIILSTQLIDFSCSYNFPINVRQLTSISRSSRKLIVTIIIAEICNYRVIFVQKLMFLCPRLYVLELANTLLIRFSSPLCK